MIRPRDEMGGHNQPHGVVGPDNDVTRSPATVLRGDEPTVQVRAPGGQRIPPLGGNVPRRREFFDLQRTGTGEHRHEAAVSTVRTAPALACWTSSKISSASFCEAPNTVARYFPSGNIMLK